MFMSRYPNNSTVCFVFRHIGNANCKMVQALSRYHFKIKKTVHICLEYVDHIS